MREDREREGQHELCNGSEVGMGAEPQCKTGSGTEFLKTADKLQDRSVNGLGDMTIQVIL